MNGQRHQCTDDTVGGRTFLALSFREKKGGFEKQKRQMSHKKSDSPQLVKKRKKAALPFF